MSIQVLDTRVAGYFCELLPYHLLEPDPSTTTMEPTRQTPQETVDTSNFNPFFWRPPADPDKPALPYLPGFSIQICRHTPAPPYATDKELDDLGYQDRPSIHGDDLYSVTQSEAVALNPPVEGVPPARTGTAHLTITSPIAIGAVRGAQVVACTITLEDGHQFRACAKIYDPLYYNFQSTIGRCPQDCVREADDDYIAETWAYNFLEQKTDQAGSFAPKYYGSWTFTLLITLKARGESIQRPVRLILLERLEGASIQGSRAQNNPARGSLTDSFHYPEEYRLEVLARAMDGYVKLKQAGIEQADFAGRNILLVINEEPGVQLEKMCSLILPRIVLVDYNNAYMRRDLSSDELETRPVNPAQEFWRNYLFRDIAGWVPGRWSDVKIQQEWLLRRFCGFDRQKLYRPVPQWMLDHFAKLHPQGSDPLVDDDLSEAA